MLFISKLFRCELAATGRDGYVADTAADSELDRLYLLAMLLLLLLLLLLFLLFSGPFLPPNSHFEDSVPLALPMMMVLLALLAYFSPNGGADSLSDNCRPPATLFSDCCCWNSFCSSRFACCCCCCWFRSVLQTLPPADTSSTVSPTVPPRLLPLPLPGLIRAARVALSAPLPPPLPPPPLAR